MINDLWYKNAVIYCLSVGTFMDANGDGVGDFEGLMRRLDYLHGLGVTAIWLMPFQPSPGSDDGYDISDYYGVDPRYGTLGDFVEFTHGAAQRGMRVHHRSRGQPHLRSASLVPGGPRAIRTRSIATGMSGPRRSRANADTRAWCFPACRNRPGRYDKVARAWYFHRFYDFQPDLNTSQPARAGRDPEDHGLLDPARRLRLSHGRGAVRDRDQGRRQCESRSSNTTCCGSLREFLQWRAGRRHHPRRSQRAARNRHGVFRRRRRPHAHDVQLPGQPAPVLRAGRRRTRARSPRRSRRQSRGRPRRNGACSCAITTSSISAASRRRSARRCSRPSAPTRTCSSTTAASAAGWRRCWAATAAGSSSPTA